MIEKSALLPPTLEILDKGMGKFRTQLVIVPCLATKSSKSKKISRARLSLIKSSLTDSPPPNRLRRMRTRGPGSASRKWCKYNILLTRVWAIHGDNL